MIGNSNRLDGIPLNDIRGFEAQENGNIVPLIAAQYQGNEFPGKFPQEFLKSDVQSYLIRNKGNIEQQITNLQAQLTTITNLQSQLEA